MSHAICCAIGSSSVATAPITIPAAGITSPGLTTSASPTRALWYGRRSGKLRRGTRVDCGVVNVPKQVAHPDAQRGVQAEWVTDEADLRSAMKVLPGSTLRLVRWPVAFFIAYVGVGLADGRVGVAFTLGSVAAIMLSWMILSLGSRGTSIRRTARLPPPERTTRITIDSERVRHETGSGRAVELPIAALTHAKLCPTGILLLLGGQVVFIPMRGVRANEEAWRAFIGRQSDRAWPKQIAFTVGLWLFAATVAAYAFLK